MQNAAYGLAQSASTYQCLFVVHFASCGWLYQLVACESDGLNALDAVLWNKQILCFAFSL